jgi:hypothetical protein
MAQQPSSLTNAWGAPWGGPSAVDEQFDLNRALLIYQAQQGILTQSPTYNVTNSYVENVGNINDINASGGSTINAKVDQKTKANQNGSANSTTNVGSGGFHTYSPILQK